MTSPRKAQDHVQSGSNSGHQSSGHQSRNLPRAKWAVIGAEKNLWRCEAHLPGLVGLTASARLGQARPGSVGLGRARSGFGRALHRRLSGVMDAKSCVQMREGSITRVAA